MIMFEEVSKRITENVSEVVESGMSLQAGFITGKFIKQNHSSAVSSICVKIGKEPQKTLDFLKKPFHLCFSQMLTGKIDLPLFMSS